jgi:ribosomal protein S18 acetylase RimI-like enzyme
VIIIRHSALRDLPRVIRIERVAFGPDSYSVSTFLAHVMRDRKGLLVAVGEDGAVIGYALVRTTLGWVGRKRGGITSIAVNPVDRRLGAGRALMDCALEYLRDQGVKQADLEVGVDNRAAQSLYEACGFRRSHLMPHYYGLNRDGIKMVLDLDVALSREHGRAPTRVRRAING